MAMASVNSLMKIPGPQSAAFGAITKSPLTLERTHHSGPSAGSYHYHHEGYSHKGGSKNRVALSALTLLSFLFFLNILQNCIQDQIDDLQGVPPNQVVVMSGRDNLVEADKREGESGLLVNTTIRTVHRRTTTTTTTTEGPDDYDPDMYFEEIEQITSGPSKIYIKKNAHDMEYR